MDIGKGLSQSFDIFKENAGALIVAALVALIVSCACFIIAGPVMAGFLVFCIKTMRGEKAEIGELFAHFDVFVPTLLLFLMIGVPLGILALIPLLNILILLILGPVAFMVSSFGILSIVQENLSPVDAIKKGLALFQKNTVNNWLYGLVMYIISGICAFITMPIGNIGMILAYQELNGTDATPSSNVTPTV
ncbi:MAG TPA: hypothetical protein VHR47_13480 [Bacillota bacterium]|nr:hypothetical protein [Bacillota bacterium]